MRQEESKARGLETRERQGGLLGEFSNVCKCIVAEGTDPAKYVRRNKHLKLVNEVQKLAWSGNT